jgi:quercetin dioxygenase-like cupin family protein
MAVFQHNDLPAHKLPRITTRVLVDLASGAASSTVWEQWISPDGFIPLHYHDVEEVLVILAGAVELIHGENRTVVESSASILIPPRELHALKPEGAAEVHLLAFFPVVSPTIFAPDGSVRPLPWEDEQATWDPRRRLKDLR